MSQAGADRYCAAHPAEQATGRCDYCGKDTCGHCVIENVAAEKAYCSESCQAADSDRQATGLANRDLLDRARRPILSGWALWARSRGALCLYSAPVAVMMASVAKWGETGDTITDAAAWIILLLFAYGVALIQVVLTLRYSGLVSGNPYVWTLRRFVPWAAAVAISFLAVIVGAMAFVLPGIYLGVRLIWADEFALVHGAGPIRALKESWLLTQGSSGAVYRFQVLVGLSSYLLFGAGAALFVGIVFLGEAAGGGPFVDLVEASLVFLFILVGYGALHSPELIYLYGMRSERVMPLSSTTKTLDI